MNRLRWLLPILVLLALANVAWQTWSRWGLITIHAQDRPLSEVVRSVEKQGGITLRTDLDPATKVNMHVTRVTLAEALETLAAVTETRWRLTYLIAPSKGEIAGALGSFAASQRPEGWRTVYFPVMGMPGLEVEEAASDPRHDTWNVKAPAQQTLQAYLEDAGRSVSAAFVFPETWNPAVSKTLKPDAISSLVPKLASAAGGKYQEVFLLQSARRRPEAVAGAEADANAGPRRAGGGEGEGREAMQQRLQAEIDKLPPEKRAAAQKEFEEGRAFFAALRDLPEDQRRTRMEEFFARPEVQEKMEEREARRDARRTPEQRVKGYQRYLERKSALQAGTVPPRGGAGGGRN